MFQKYLIELDEWDRRSIRNNIKLMGIENNIKWYLNHIDCTRIYENGDRPNQTINYQYRHAISSLMYILDKALNNPKPLITKTYYDETLNKIKEIHLNNLEFEKTNPPIVYSKKRKTVKKTVKSSSNKTTEPKDKIKKPTKAELKLAEKAAKLNKLTVNFKINQA